MNCQEIHQKDLLEACVAGQLSGELLEEVEAHYFGCDRCALYLHDCRLAQRALREKAAAIRSESLRMQRAWPRWLPAAMAAAGLLAAILFCRKELSLPRQ